MSAVTLIAAAWKMVHKYIGTSATYIVFLYRSLVIIKHVQQFTELKKRKQYTFDIIETGAYNFTRLSQNEEYPGMPTLHGYLSN
jgi:hypothetical protein